jgi:hypothetical protein
VALVRTYVSQELSNSIRMTGTGEVGKLTVTSNRRTLLGISSQRASVAS